MRQRTTPAIVLRRTDYAEADRIVTFLTPTGKVRAIVKGVRRSKSKLAGGIELFSESTITFLETSGDLGRIVSTRLETYYEGIVGELQRMMFGYEAMKLLDKIVEDDAEKEYYELLKATLEALSDSEIPLFATEVWFYVRLLKLLGHEPNVKTDLNGQKLQQESLYMFSIDDMCFIQTANGIYSPDHIKLLRLALGHKVGVMKQVKNIQKLATDLQPLIKQLAQLHAN